MNVHFTIDKYFRSDADFNELYSSEIQLVGDRHWTPVHIARLTARFLAGKNARILDIGSGVGKFCLAAAYFAPTTHFFGVEQRQFLIDHALHAQDLLGIKNVSFINRNFIELDLKEYDHFYFFNSFFENIDPDRIDDSVEYSRELYENYAENLYKGWQEMPVGTRIATYHTPDSALPVEYELVDTLVDGELKFWIKK